MISSNEFLVACSSSLVSIGFRISEFTYLFFNLVFRVLIFIPLFTYPNGNAFPSLNYSLILNHLNSTSELSGIEDKNNNQ